MKVEEFRENILEDIKYSASIEMSNDQEEFTNLAANILIDAEEIDDFTYLHYEGIGRKGKKIQIDGYSYNELDECLSLFICTSVSYLQMQTLTNTEIERLFSKVISFIEESDYILENSEESSAGYGFAFDIKHHYEKIRKYRFIIITEKIMSSQIKTLQSEMINNIPVEKSIWDIERLFQIIKSSTGKEDIIIDVLEFTENGIPCLKASKTEDYEAYLCNIPGLVLANLYNTYGGRLLEGNVRSFLQTKGKVNKGIRNTVLNNPENFFAYNNGIAATASTIKTQVKNNTSYITEISSLQIVNGGQTTASLAMALLNDKRDNSEEQIKKIYVPMKLSIVTPEKAQELIPNISRFANSQNKVSDADLWSNHPFQILMEEFSRSIITPAIGGKQYGTHWYYERANGQYRQETYKCSAAEKKKFEMLNPINQMIKKVDLAKYWNIKNLRPDTASAGGQKAFQKFASYINVQWVKNNTVFNKGFFKEIIAVAILFKESDKIVKHQSWYNSYKANIVAYTISVIIYNVKTKYPGKTISYNDIWLHQQLSEIWKKQITITSKIVYEYLIDNERHVENVTEWAKYTECWEKAKDLDINLLSEFENELIYKDEEIENKKVEKTDQKLTNNVKKMEYVAEFGIDNWKLLYQWNIDHNVLNPTEISFIKLAIAMEKGRFPSEKQCVRIVKILESAREAGFSK